MSVGTAVTTKCLVAQEAAGWGEGGGARQLVPHKAGSTNTISPELGRAARNWNCSLGNPAPSACSPLRPECSFWQRQRDENAQVCAQRSPSQRGQSWPSSLRSQPPSYTDPPYLPSLLVFPCLIATHMPTNSSFTWCSVSFPTRT